MNVAKTIVLSKAIYFLDQAREAVIELSKLGYVSENMAIDIARTLVKMIVDIHEAVSVVRKDG